MSDVGKGIGSARPNSMFPPLVIFGTRRVDLPVSISSDDSPSIPSHFLKRCSCEATLASFYFDCTGWSSFPIFLGFLPELIFHFLSSVQVTRTRRSILITKRRLWTDLNFVASLYGGTFIYLGCPGLYRVACRTCPLLYRTTRLRRL